MTEEQIEEVEQEEEESQDEGLTYDEAFMEAADELRGEAEAAAEVTDEEPEAREAKAEKSSGGDDDEFQVENLADPSSEEAGALPQSWNHQGDGEVWNELPEEAREVVKRNEQNLYRLVQKKANELHEQAQQVAPIAHVVQELAPIADKWRRGAKPLTMAEGILRDVSTCEHLRQELSTKEGAIKFCKDILRKRQIGPEALVETRSETASNEVMELREQVETLNNKISQSEQTQTSSQVESFRREFVDAYNRFATTKNAFGDTKYPDAGRPMFAKEMGYLVSQRAQQVPGETWQQRIAQCYKELQGQIQSGNGARSSSTEHLKEAASSAYAKGAGSTPRPQLYDNYDDAFMAVAEEYGMTE